MKRRRLNNLTEAFCDALRYARPTRDGAALLLLAGNCEAAEFVAMKLAGDDHEPLTAVAFSAAHEGDLDRARRCCEVLEHAASFADTQSASAGVVTNATMALMEWINDPRDRSVSDFCTSSILALREAAPDDTPTLRAMSARHTESPIDALREDASLSREVRAGAELFFSGRPELALITLNGAFDTPTGAAVRWLASAQAGAIERDIAAILDDTTAVSPLLAHALAEESETLLGHTRAIVADTLPASYHRRLMQRRSGGGTHAYRIWWAAARLADRFCERREALAVDRVRAALQRDDLEAASEEAIHLSGRLTLPAEAAEVSALAALITAAEHPDDRAAIRALFHTAIERDPTSLRAAVALAEWEITIDAPLTTKPIEALLRIAPCSTESLSDVVRAGDVLARAGRSNAAGIDALNDAANAAPDATHRWLALSELHARLDDWLPAADALEEAARSNDDPRERASLYRQLGRLYADHLGDLQPALEYWMVSFFCWSGSAQTLNQLERAYHALQRTADLASLYDLAIAYAEEHPSDAEFTTEQVKERRDKN